MKKFTSINLDNVTIDGVACTWSDLCRAAVQDHTTDDRDRRGMWLRPNGDTALADAYRQILRDVLPLAKAAEKSSYEAYCGVGVTTRQSSGVHAAGHGSWVSGPDGSRQATWHAWQRLCGKITEAMCQPKAV